MTARDDAFVRLLSKRLGSSFYDARAEVAKLEAGPPGVTRPGGERKVSMYVVHHSAGPINNDWRDIWRFHLFSRGWDTGGYNAIVEADGRLVLTVPPSRMTYGAGPKWNPITVHICAVGNYEDREPPMAMLNSIWQWLCTCDDVLGYQPWRPHGALKQTACPGRYLRSQVWNMARLGAADPRPSSYPF